MTPGHRHRVIRLRPDGVLYRLLKTPLAHTTDSARAERSRWVWGPYAHVEHEGAPGDVPSTQVQQGYRLTALGVLHTLTGLTIETRRGQQ